MAGRRAAAEGVAIRPCPPPACAFERALGGCRAAPPLDDKC